MNNITINSNSNDIKEMEKLFPRAPLKIIAIEGCKELGQKVNDYIVNFRRICPWKRPVYYDRCM